MAPAHGVQFETPKGVSLHGLWFGPKKAKRAIVLVHGFTSSAFARLDLVELLIDRETAVLTFNNRGNGIVSRIRHSKKADLQLGAARETFTECVDDIDGALRYVRRSGAKQLFLMGHSTGCQKSVFWASKRKGGKGIRGIILLAPVDDYAAGIKTKGKKALMRAMRVAKEMVRVGKSHDLMPKSAWYELLEAQRFVSLYSQDSAESVFPYTEARRKAKALRSVNVPIVGFWAEKGEFSNEPVPHIVEWFRDNGVALDVIPGSGHAFKGFEKKLATSIRRFMESPRNK